MVILFQTAQFVNIHLHLVLLAGLLELLFIDIIAADGVGLEQDDIILVGSFKMPRHKDLFHHQVVDA